MNTPISFEVAKLLKEKGYSLECEEFYTKGVRGVGFKVVVFVKDGVATFDDIKKKIDYEH